MTFDFLFKPVEELDRLSALPWAPRVVLTSVDPDAASPDQVERSGACGFVPKHDLADPGLKLLKDGR